MRELNSLLFVLCQIDTGQPVVEHLLQENESSALEVLRSFKHVRHVLDVLGVVAVQFRQRLLVALPCRVNLLTTLVNLVLQFLHLQYQAINQSIQS